MQATQTCPRCHEAFEPRRGSGGHPQVYCSALCSVNYRANGPLVERGCDMCGARFLPRRMGTERPKRYCGDACQKAALSLWAKYRMTPQQYNAQLARQGGGCAVCGKPPAVGRRLAVDHDHDCCPYTAPQRRRPQTCGECNRGLLCVACNAWIGQLGDSPDRMIAAAAYLLQRADVLAVVT